MLTNEQIYEKMFELGMIPVVVIDDEADAEPIAEALIAGGLPAAEITFRTPAARGAIRKIADKFGDKILVGAGTVLTEEQVDAAIDAGAQFIVSPGFSENVVRHGKMRGVTVIPGCSRPTDIEAALRMGLSVVKFFPAEAAGGLAMIKAMSAPYGSICFMPTGGIDEHNMNDYLAFPKILACGGSFMVKKDWVTNREFSKITEACRATVRKIHGFRLAHVGIYPSREANGTDRAQQEATLAAAFSPFGFTEKRGEESTFYGDAIEWMTAPKYGTNGHIAFEVQNLPRAEAYLRARGLHFIEESRAFDKNGKPLSLYVGGDFGGFAVHLVEKR